MATPVLWGTADILVNVPNDFAQGDPQVVALKDGTFLAVWADASKGTADWDIRGQIFHADGTKKGTDFIVNGREIPSGGGGTTIDYTGTQTKPKVAVLADGRFVVTWIDGSGYGDGTFEGRDNSQGIRARIFNPDGTPAPGGDFWVNTTRAGEETDPSIAALSNGGFVISYTVQAGFNDTDIRAQAFDANGNKIGGTATSTEVKVNTTTLKEQRESAVVGLGDGKYAVFYTDVNSNNVDDPLSTVRVKVNSLDGSGTEFLVPSSRGPKALPSVALLKDGKYIATWIQQDENTGDGSGWAAKAQMYDAAGNKLGGEFLVNSITAFSQWDPVVTALPDGGFAISYSNGFVVGSPRGFGVAVFDAQGNRTGADFLHSLPPSASGTGKSSLTALADGRLVLSWGETSSPTSGRDDKAGVYARILDPRDKAVTVTGAGLNDEYIGTRFNDTLNGRAGDDRLSGDAGDDTLMGGTGADILDGGEGNDTASYADAGGDVVANLDDRGLNTGDALNDTYISIENLTGSGFKDKLTGNGSNNVLNGGDDNDTLAGGAGSDTLIGGNGADELDGGTGADTLSGGQGNDTYIVDNASDKVEEKAGEGYDIVTASVTYVLDATAEIEELHAAAGSAPINLTGSNSSNKIYGNGAANILDGGLGADFLQGGAGNDTYIIDHAGDAIKEDAGDDQGNDKVIIAQDFQADHSYNLTAYANVEAIEALNSAGNVNLTGNSGSNLIIGNDGTNTLDGGIDSAVDTLQGGKGDDTYVIRDRSDIISEKGGEGNDTALVLSATYELGKDMSIETIRADKSGGVSHFTLTGSNLGNTIEGADGNDVLDGGGAINDAADKLDGGDGNDTYYVRRSSDIVVEAAGMGSEDKIIASANYVLLDNVHVETMQAADGNAKINLTGNSSANKLIGNAGDNALEGGGGNDDIDGGGGFNTAVFTGARAGYTITRNGDGTYTITDATPGRDGTDTLRNVKYARFSDEIVDLQAPATMSIVADNATQNEGNGGGWVEYTFTISRTNDFGEATVTWKVVGAGAGDDDFEMPIADMTGTIAFANGESSKTITVRVRADAVDEEHEAFNVVLSDLTGAVMGSSSASGLIINDDAPVTMSIGAADAAKYEGDTGYTEYTFTVTRSSGKGAASATWTVTGIDGGAGTASTAEFEALTGTVNFAADETTQTITIRVKGDKQVEGNETFSVKLSGATGADITTDTAAGLIINDDAVPLISISATDAIKNEGDAGFTEYTFTITRSSGDGTSSVKWTVVGTGDHPVSLDDIETITETVTFENGETSKVVRIRVKADVEIESDQTFAVVLSSPTDATIGSNSASGKVVNDDVLNLAPTNIRLTTGGTTAVVQENKTSGTVATVTADDDAGAEGLRYYLVAEDANFEIDEITGQIRIKAGADLNFEGVKTYTLKVKVRDLNGTGLEETQDITINLADVNEAPVLGAAVTAVTVSENAANDDVVAHFTLDDPDAGEDFIYEILGIPAAFAGAFAVDTVNKTIVVADRSKLAVASTQNFTLTLKVTDKKGGAGSISDTQDFTITVQDIPPGNTAPENIRLTTGEDEVFINESMTAGTVARVMADDNGSASELRYYLADNPYFVIDALSGEIRVKSSARLDFEALADGRYTVHVTVKDLNGVGASATHSIVINIDDVNEAASGITFTDSHIVKAGVTLKDANVVLATAVDPDTNVDYQDNLYRFANGTTTDGIFTIDVNTGKITTNRNVTSSDVGDYVLTVVAYDAQNHSLVRTISYPIKVVAADNAAPTLDGVSEPVAAQSNTGTVNPFRNVDLTNEDGETLTVTIRFANAKGTLSGAGLSAKSMDGDDAVYTISAMSAGDLEAKLAALVFDPRNREVGEGVEDTEFTLTVTDGEHPTPGDAQTGTVTVSATAPGVVGNVAPTGLSLNGSLVGSINEYAQPGKEIGTLSATDANGDALTYSIVGDAGGGRFKIVGNKLLLDGPGVNFEEAKSHQIKVQVTDNKGGVEEKIFTINVTDEWTLVLNGKVVKGKAKNDKLNGGAQDDILNGKKGNDTVKGLAGDDKVYGDVGDDKVYGGFGLDTLSGGKGNDKLYGEAGNDMLYGDEGNDQLTGGLGSDTFVFDKKANKETNFDQIKDFKSGEDKIFLENKIFKKLGAAGTIDAPAKLDASLFSVGKAKDNKDFLVYKKGILFYDTNGKAAGGEVEIMKVKGLKATDIFII